MARPPQLRKRYRCVMCTHGTSTKTEMRDHIAEMHSFLKLEGQGDEGGEAAAKKSGIGKLSVIKTNLKTNPAPTAEKRSSEKRPAVSHKKRVELWENSTAGDILMRNWVQSFQCADIAPLWQCLACRKQFAEKMDLQDHVHLKHVESADNKDGPLKLRMLGFCCEVCGRCFDELEYMIGHHVTMHPDAAPPSFEYLKHSTDWAMLCFVCLLYYRRSDKWFTGHQCTNWVDVEAVEKMKEAISIEPCFLCDVCAATFRYKSAYQFHRVARHKGVTEIDWDSLQPADIPFVCEKCEKGFSSIVDFQVHVCDTATADILQLALEKPKVPCPHCPSKLSSVKIMRRHVKMVHEKSIPSTEERRRNGRKSLRPEMPTIKCPFCELKFKTTKNMMVHAKEVHNQELRSPFYCATCARHFVSNAKLSQHNSIYHSGPEDEATVMAACREAERTKDDTVFYMCPQCARKFIEPIEYFRHHQWHQVKREFTCDRCGYSAPTKDSLKVHMRSVHREAAIRRFQCELCDSVLSSRFSLREHQAATHGSEKPYVCERCGKDFPTKVRLQSHIRVHLFGSQLSISRRRYGCDLCGKDFKKKQTLRDHLAVHSGVKNEACSECGKLFFTKLSAYCHRMQAHCTVRPFKCTQCEATFPLRSFLTRHTKKHAQRAARLAATFSSNSLWMSKSAGNSADQPDASEEEIAQETLKSENEQQFDD